MYPEAQFGMASLPSKAARGNSAAASPRQEPHALGQQDANGGVQISRPTTEGKQLPEGPGRRP